MTATLARFDGAAAWAGLSPDQQTEIGAIALELVASWHIGQRCLEDNLDRLFGRANEAADDLLVWLLHGASIRAVGEASFEGPDDLPRIPSLLGPVCRACGCSETDACEGGCGWAEPDLCTACVSKAEAA